MAALISKGNFEFEKSSFPKAFRDAFVSGNCIN